MLVSYTVSLIFGLIWLYNDEIFLLIGWNIFSFGSVKDRDMLFELSIPRINLKEVVYTIDSDLNNVDYHVEILENSNLEKNLYFLAAHSGSSKASYFDDLVYLEKGDLVWINVEERSYVFVVEDIFYIHKIGYFEVNYDTNGNTLFLITCSLKYVNKQLVVKARLIYKC